MIFTSDLEIRATANLSAGGRVTLVNILRSVSANKVTLWVKTPDQFDDFQIPQHVCVKVFTALDFFAPRKNYTQIIYLNAFKVFNPPNTNAILMLQNILYLKPFRTNDFKGKCRKILFKLTLNLLAKKDEIFVHTNHVQELLKLEAPTLKARVKVLGIDHPFNTEHLSEINAISENKIVSGFVYPTSNASHKNNKKLVAIWRKLTAIYHNCPPLFITICQKDLEDDDDNCGEQNIKFVGHLSYEELYALFDHKALLFVSENETLGLPILEAKKLLRPVVLLNKPWNVEHENIDYRLNDLNEHELVQMLDFFMKEYSGALTNGALK